VVNLTNALMGSARATFVNHDPVNAFGTTLYEPNSSKHSVAIYKNPPTTHNDQTTHIQRHERENRQLLRESLIDVYFLLPRQGPSGKFDVSAPAREQRTLPPASAGLLMNDLCRWAFVALRPEGAHAPARSHFCWWATPKDHVNIQSLARLISHSKLCSTFGQEDLS
jgi:hypothetical protein